LGIKLRGSAAELLKLFWELDAGDRLMLLPGNEESLLGNVGAFAVHSNEEKDRLVIDAREPNGRVEPIKRWTSLMAHASVLVHIVINPDQVGVVSADDLSDYYYQFRISKERARRNMLRGRWFASSFRGMRAWTPELEGCKYVRVCIDTLAMGDCDAVEFGMAARLGVAAIAGAIKQDELLSLSTPVPRGRYFAGIIQDDHCAVELEPRAPGPGPPRQTIQPPDTAVAGERFDAMARAYIEHELFVNAKKSVRRQARHLIWGAFSTASREPYQRRRRAPSP